MEEEEFASKLARYPLGRWDAQAARALVDPSAAVSVSQGAPARVARPAMERADFLDAVKAALLAEYGSRDEALPVYAAFVSHFERLSQPDGPAQ